MSTCFATILRVSAPLMLGLMLVANAGCGGGPPGKSSGSATLKITFDGQPVTEGSVSLQNANGEGGGGVLNAEGVANIPVIPKGNYVVTVTPPLADVAAPAPGTKLPPPKLYPNIPGKFRRTETSKLQAEIKDAKNEFKFDLKQ